MLTLLSLAAIAAAADTTYQGRLTDALGDPIEGQQSVTLTIHSQAQDGQLVATLPLGDITFSNGYFSVILEDVDAAWFEGSSWMQFTVGGQSLAPRQRLVGGVGGTAAPSGTPTSPAVSCRALHQDFPNLPSGEYTVDPDRDGADLQRVYCDMQTAGGGWTLVARASDTNGAGDDYEFRAAVGANSVLDLDTSVGTPSDAQYLLGLDDVVPPDQADLQIMYYCYSSQDPEGTNYWVHTGTLDAGVILADSGLVNPDKLYATSLVNKGGDRTSTGNFALFRRDGADNGPSCGNGHAGQTGMKYSCGYSGQIVMPTPSVWLLTHYSSSTAYTEVTSCGSVGGAVMPFYAGEVRFR